MKHVFGQTKRSLGTRCEEHEDNLKRNKKYYIVVTKHIKEFSEEKHDVDLENIKILRKESNWKKRCVAEMYYIKREKHSINKMTDLEEFPHIFYCVKISLKCSVN